MVMLKICPRYFTIFWKLKIKRFKEYSQGQYSSSQTFWCCVNFYTQQKANSAFLLGFRKTFWRIHGWSYDFLKLILKSIVRIPASLWHCIELLLHSGKFTFCFYPGCIRRLFVAAELLASVSMRDRFIDNIETKRKKFLSVPSSRCN